MAGAGRGDWTIRSTADPRYVVAIRDVDQAHAELVLSDLIENVWVPSDLTLDPVKRPRRRPWRRRWPTS